MALIFADGFDKYGVDADLDATYTDRDTNTKLLTTGGVNGGGAIDLTFNRGLSFPLANSSQEVFVVTQIFFSNESFSNSNLMYFIDGGATINCELELTTGGLLKAVRGVTTLETSTEVVSRDSFLSLEVRVLIDNAAGRFVVIVDGTTFIDFTGDTQQGAANVSSMKVWGANPINVRYDDLIVMDDSGTENNALPGHAILIETLRPDGDGTTNDWTPTGAGTTNADRVDDTPGKDGDTTYVSSGTIADKDLYTFDDIATAGSLSFDGVQITNVARKEGAGNRNINNTVKSGATESDGVSESLTTTFMTYSTLHDIDPNTSAAWTETNINALEAGIEVNS